MLWILDVQRDSLEELVSPATPKIGCFPLENMASIVISNSIFSYNLFIVAASKTVTSPYAITTIETFFFLPFVGRGITSLLVALGSEKKACLSQ